MPPLPLSSAAKSPRTLKVHAETQVTEEQVKFLKKEQYETAQIIIPQVQDPHDSSDNSNDGLPSPNCQIFSNDDDDDDKFIGRELSNHNHPFDRRAKHKDNNSDDDNSCTMYNPGGMKNNGALGSTTQATIEDTTGNSSTSSLSTDAPYPFDHDITGTLNSLSSNGGNNKDSDDIAFEADSASDTIESPDAHSYSTSDGHGFIHDPGGEDSSTISIEDTWTRSDSDNKYTRFHSNSSSLLDLRTSQVLDNADTTSKSITSKVHQHFVYNPGGHSRADKHIDFATALTAQSANPVHSLERASHPF